MVRTVPTVGNVDQSLEDICKQQLDSKRGGAKKGGSQKRASPQKQRNERRGSVGKARGGSSRGGGGGYRGDVQVAENGAQKTNLFSGRSRSEGRPERDNQRTKMMVSNLDYKVSQKDMEELFAEFPDFSKAVLHFDQNARSLGTCELSFRSRSGAMKAHKQYNGVPLDGKSMRIEVLGDVQMAPVSSRLGRKNSPQRQQRDRSPFRRARGGRGGRPNQKPAGNGGKPQREKREKKETPSAEDLDKELDNYLAAGTSN